VSAISIKRVKVDNLLDIYKGPPGERIASQIEIRFALETRRLFDPTAKVMAGRFWIIKRIGL
jgi:hypothetical protein